MVARVPCITTLVGRRRGRPGDRERAHRGRAGPSRSGSKRGGRRERLRSLPTSRVGPRSPRLERGASSPGIPGQFFMLDPPGRLLPRPMYALPAPQGELALSHRPDRARARGRSARARPGDEIAVLGPLGNGFQLDVDEPAARRRRHRRSRRFPYLSEWLGRPSGGARLPERVACGGGRARAQCGGRPRADAT